MTVVRTPALVGLVTEPPIEGVSPVECRSPIRPLHCPVLLALGALNVWTARQQEDYDALSTALCLRVCAAGLFGEDWCNADTVAIERRTSRCIPEPQRGTLPEPLVLPGSWPATSTDSPTAGSWWSSRTVRLPLSGRTGWPPELRPLGTVRELPVRARNIDHDRRLAKPAIVTTIEGVRSGCAWRWSPCGRSR